MPCRMTVTHVSDERVPSSRYGNAIVYWSATDNRTNDSSIKFAQRP